MLAAWTPGAAAQLACRGQGAPLPAVRRGHEVRFQPRIAAISRALSGPRADVLMIGDSITQQWPDDMLQSAFPGRKVVNAGVAGDTTAATLFRLSGQRTPAVVAGNRTTLGIEGWTRQAPKLVVLLIGTNDLRATPPCGIVAGVLANAQRIHSLYPAARVAVVGLLPRGRDGRERATDIRAINGGIARGIGGLGKSYSFVDAGGALQCGATGACDLRRPPNYVHLTPDAYRRFAALLRTRLSAAAK